MAERPPPPDTCANCGADIPRHAKACPGCGADERTGWRESSIYDGLDLPAEAWRDDTDPAGTGADGGPRRSPHVNGVPWYWWLVGVGLVLALATGALALR